MALVKSLLVVRSGRSSERGGMTGAGGRGCVCVCVCVGVCVCVCARVRACAPNSGLQVFPLGGAGGGAASAGCWSQLAQASQLAGPVSAQLSSVTSRWKLNISQCEYLHHRN